MNAIEWMAAIMAAKGYKVKRPKPLQDPEHRAERVSAAEAKRRRKAERNRKLWAAASAIVPKDK